MNEFRMALVGLNQTPLDWNGNLARIHEARARARALNANLICFPELALSGYGCEDNFLHADVASRSLRMARELAATTEGEVMLLGLPFYHEQALYNGVAVLNEGRIAGITLKSHLAREGIHYEPRWFRPWPLGAQATTTIDGQTIPIGTLTYNVDGLSFALEICEDAWVEQAQRPCGFTKDAAWIFNCSASHFSMGKADIREQLVRQSSKTFGVGYAYCNLVGCESGRAIYDGEQLIAEEGVITNRSARLYMDDVLLLCHDISYTPTEKGRVALHIQRAETLAEIEPPTRIRHQPHADEEFARAASLALLDYMRKSRSFGFTLSLSGGVDSATVAVLVAVMARRLITELDEETRIKKLDFFFGNQPCPDTPEALVGQLLTTIYQATRNSGDITRHAAAALAEAIGARHMAVDVDSLVEGYKSMIGQAIGRPLSWETDDITLQNIQARVRAPGVWMLANLNRSLLLTTSNRSEVAVGYATMDGDTCGGLAPIAGVEKTFLRRWLVVMEKQGLPGIPVIPQLSHVNQQQPTAELRPPEASQSDEDDLMPYTVLDTLEAALIAQRKTPLEAFQVISERFSPNYAPKALYRWTRDFCFKFATSQWKRERYAPAFHLDDRNLDPKTWARYPILNGVFQAELAELAQWFEEHHGSGEG